MYDRIVISGAGGMLGRSLAAALEARGRSPIALDRARLDIADDASIARVFREHRPTLLLNAAAHTKVDLCEEEPDRADAINGHAVGTLARCCREYGTTMVHFSTDFVFDGRGRTTPYHADEPTNPISAYGRSKLLGETDLQANGPRRWLIVRTAWAYGTGGANFPRIIVERARQGQPLRVVNDEVGSPTYTHDLAEATLDLLGADAAGIWHVTNAGDVSRFNFAKAILEEFGLDGAPITPITTAEWLLIRPKQACRPAYSVLDVSAVAQKLGRPMRHWREALRAFRAEVESRGGF
jgi:dTDP-4-dehydrorhamnose reductase